MVLASGELSIAICDRCRKKRPYRALVPDGNSPGLRVCRDKEECYDNLDPYRLPPRGPDPIALRFARPDAPLVDNRQFMISEDGEWIEVVPPPGDASP
jgi:hypothetical protein